MASKRPQTMAKRAREQAVMERRERKRAKKAEAAAERAAAKQVPPSEVGDDGATDAPASPEQTASS
jgi:hypothetical protein